MSETNRKSLRQVKRLQTRVRLDAVLVDELHQLASREGLPLDVLIGLLVSEAIVHRLRELRR